MEGKPPPLPLPLSKKKLFSLKSGCFSPKIGKKKKKKKMSKSVSGYYETKKKKKKWHGPLISVGRVKP